jgi:hypothetical protein
MAGDRLKKKMSRIWRRKIALLIIVVLIVIIAEALYLEVFYWSHPITYLKYRFRDPKRFGECLEAGGEFRSGNGPTSSKPFPTCIFHGKVFEGIPEPGPLFLR